MRERIYTTNAERQKAYRLRNNINDIERLFNWAKEAGNNRNKTPKAKQRSSKRYFKKKVETPFIGFDGEGINKKNGKHILTLMSASDGEYIENYTRGLTPDECFDFFLNYHKSGICIGFSFNYDITMCLKQLPDEIVNQLWETREATYKQYNLFWIPGKIFSIQSGKRKTDLYDVFGFFQKSFISSLQEWGIEVPKEITEGKKDRATFTASQKLSIRKYNHIECELLVEMMNRLRQAFYEVDIVPKKWFGAGAVATAILDKHEIKFHNADQIKMMPKFLGAYYGGRNQLLKMGCFKIAYTHDINSAYPSVMQNLPTAIGKWHQANEEVTDYDWCIYKVTWKLPANERLTPFPVRHKGSIYWPLSGSGWYWQPEVKAAFDYYGEKYFAIDECYFFEPSSDVKPFAFIPKYYAKRKELLLQGSLAQLALKLGLNALYGKTAQSVASGGYKPVYQNYFWSGYITSQTRAEVFKLATINPDKVISFATDGVVASEKLIEHSPQKELGLWEVAEVKNYFAVQTGVYCYDTPKGTKYKSRGFHHTSVDYEALRKCWRKHSVYGEFEYTERRFIGVGTGRRSKEYEIGEWYDQTRTITLMPQTMLIDSINGESIDLNPVLFINAESETYEMKSDWTLNELDEEKIEKN